MNDSAIKRVEAENNLGINALKNRRRDKASTHFQNALDIIEEIKNAEEKHKALSLSATLYGMAGFNDLAVMASKDATELSIELGDYRQAAKDMLTYGNALFYLGKKDEAEKTFQETLQMCLDKGDYANAASASTNLANLAAKPGEMGKAIGLLKNSLRYLERMPHPDTEINTRIALIQIMELEQHDPESVIAIAKELYSRFSEKLRPEQRKVVSEFLNQTIGRFLKAHPDIDGETWKAEHLHYLDDWKA